MPAAFTDAELAAEREREQEGVAAPTSMMRAAAVGDSARVRALLAAGVGAGGGKGRVDERSAFGMTALMHAAASGDVESVRALLAGGAKTEAQDMDGWTPLLFAAHNARLEAARALVGAGASVARCNKRGVRAAEVAAAVGAKALAAFLVAAEA